MSPRVELVLTIMVCALGGAYFVWRAIVADDDDRLLYIAFVIIGAVIGHRAINDVLAKRRRSQESAEQAGSGEGEDDRR